MLQGRIQDRYRGAFVKWALMADLRAAELRSVTCSDMPEDQSCPGTPNGVRPFIGVPKSSALIRFGLAPHGFTASLEPRVSPNFSGNALLQSSFPGWLRPSLRAPVALHVQQAGEVLRAGGDANDSSGSSRHPVRRKNPASLAAHIVEEVLAQRGSGRVTQYRVKWKGFASSQSVTWELGSQLHKISGFREVLTRFETKRGLQQGGRG